MTVRGVWLIGVALLVMPGAFHALGQPPKPPPPPLEFTGRLTTVERVSVSSSVSGQVVELLVKEGQQVKKGEVLARLDATRQTADARRAEARLAAAQARLAELRATIRAEDKAHARAEVGEAEAAMKLAEAEVIRVKRLRAMNAATADEVRKAEAALRLAEARAEKQQTAYNLLLAGPPAEKIKTAQADVAVAQAERDRARTLLDATTVRAPIDGVVLKLNVSIGSFTNPDAFGLVRTASIGEIGDTSAFEVEVDIHERNFARFFKGQRCEVRLDTSLEEMYRGVVDRISSTVDRDRNTFTVWVRLELPKKAHNLPVDASATVRFLPR